MYKTLIKGVTTLAAAAGTSTIMGNVISTYIPTNMGKVNKACTAIGKLALMGIVSDFASNYAVGKIDWLFNTIDKVNEAIDQVQSKQGDNPEDLKEV